jgi:hypothetical protein
MRRNPSGSRCLPGAPEAIRACTRITILIGVLTGGLFMAPAYAEGPPDGGYPMSLESTIRVNPEDFRAIQDGIWHHIQIGDLEPDNLTRHIDDPQLPVMVKWFLLPPGTSVASLSAVPLEQTEVEGVYLPYPIVGEEQDGLESPPDSPPWDGIVFPREQAFLCQVGEARRYQLAKIALYPLQYDALRQSIRILESIRLSVTLRSMTADESQARLQIRRPEAADDVFRVHRRWIRGLVENPEDLDRFYPIYAVDESEDGGDDGARRARSLTERTPLGSFVSEWPSTVGQQVDYLIITNNYDENGNDIGDMESAFRGWAADLPTLSVAVRTVDFIETGTDPGIGWDWSGYDRADRIRNFLRLAVERWGTTYVLLAGDEAVVPTRRLGGLGQANPFPPYGSDLDRPDPVCDYWYTRIGSDWAESWNTDGDAWIGEDTLDVGLGAYEQHGFSSIFLTRLPARNADEAAAMIGKTYSYLNEIDLPPDQWYLSAMAAAGPTNSSAVPPAALGESGITNAEHILEPLINAGNWDIRRLYPNVGAAKSTRCVNGNNNCHCPARGDTCYKELHDYIHDLVGDDYWVGDDLRAVLTNPETVPHLLYHMEHSERDRLGGPSGFGAEWAPNYGCPADWSPSACIDALDKVLKSSTEHLDINQVLALRNGLSDEHRYMFVFSSGSWTNMMDMNSIGESFLRAPDGGAVFYVGKAATFGGTRYSEYRNSIQNAFVEGVVPFSAAVHFGIDEAFSEFTGVRPHTDLNLLGDAVLFAWRGIPTQPTVAVSPNTITGLGIQSVTVTITDPDTSEPIEGALVGLKQGDWTAARVSTDAQGHAAFKGVLIQNATDSVSISVFRPGYPTATVAVPVSVSAPYVVYASHELDDCVTGGDCDGVFEAGESCEIDVTLKNEGSSATQTGFAVLRPTPPFVMKLQINGEYRPGDIYLGKSGAHPGTDADSFRVPISERGIRVEGTPPSGPTLQREVFRIWRGEGTGLYTLGAYSHSQSGDSVFTGVIKGEADFSNVSLTGEGADQYFASGDSIWFEFHGDASEDKITFRAEAPNWFTMNTSTVSLPALQAGATTTVTFSTTNLDDLPDRSNIVFTVSAYQGLMATTYFTSDFVVQSAKPEIALVGVDGEIGDFGCADTSWRWTPVIHNRGSGAADSVRVVLHKTAGSLCVLDSTVTLVDIGPGALLSDGSFLLCGESIADTIGFAASITEEVFHKEYSEIGEYGNGGGPFGDRENSPECFTADLEDGTVVLWWCPLPQAERYLLEYGNSPTGPRTPLDEVSTEATRYEVLLDLGAPDYDTPYYFWVRGCYPGGRCSPRSQVGPVYPWAHEREGWPKLLPGMSICAPLVGDLGEGIEDGGLAIFAATNRIFAWRPDGTSLDSNSTDGSFCDPFDLQDEEPAVDERFTEALAFGDLSAEHQGPELIGNFRGKGFFLIGIQEDNGRTHCLPHWGNGIYSNQSPIVAPYIENEASTLILIGGTSDSHIYGWFAQDPSLPVGTSHLFATLPDGSAYNYESLAIGCDSGYPEVIAMTREGNLYCYGASDPGSGGTLRWQRSLDPGARILSTPAVGNVDTDESNEIVLTTLWRSEEDGACTYGPYELVPGRVFLVDEASGDTTSVGSCDFHFRDESGDVPPAGPSLAQLDTDDPLEILVPSAHANGIGGESIPVGITLVVFEVESEEIVTHTAVDSIPYGTRNDETGHPFDYGEQYPIGSPVVGDFDPDGEYAKPDIFVTTSQGAIFCFEYDYQADPPLYAKPGWPLLLPDVAREPVLEQLDPEDPGQFSLVVQCQDGALHVFDLPRKSSSTGSAPDWGSYGGDNRNTRGKFICTSQRPTGDHADLKVKATIRRVGPTPSHGPQDIVVSAAEETQLRLDLYDVSGRRVRGVFEGAIRPGSTILSWDGNLESGDRAPSGIYWYRLRSDSGTEVRRIVVVR